MDFRIVIFCALTFASFSAGASQPSVSIVTPVGGEFYIVGQTQRVQLADKTKAKSVLIELSRDGGTTFSILGTINDSTRDLSKRNVLSYAVTGPVSSNCVIRATANGVSATSGGFTIATTFPPQAFGTAGGDLTGTYPNPTIAAGAVTTAKISSGAASSNFVLVADGNGGTSFVTPSTLGVQGPPNGPAGGDLTGNYPNPTINQTTVQKRVTGTTPAGQFLTAINQDGTVNSGVAVTSIAAGTGISVTGTANTPSVAVNFGTTAGTVTQGNDARLSDARSPTAGSAFYIQNGTTAQTASFNVTGNGTVGGTLTANSVTISTATRFFSIHNSAFVIDATASGFHLNYQNGFATPAGTGTVALFAPINLPQGAIITGVSAGITQGGSGASATTVSLAKEDLLGNSTVIAGTQTTGNTPAIVTTTTSSTVDNSSFTYYLQIGCDLSVNSPSIYGAIVTYTVTSPLP